MKIIDFDEFADKYSNILQKNLGCFGSLDYFAEFKVTIVRNYLKKEPHNILEYGCGIGQNIKFFPTNCSPAGINRFITTSAEHSIPKTRD